MKTKNQLTQKQKEQIKQKVLDSGFTGITGLEYIEFLTAQELKGGKQNE